MAFELNSSGTFTQYKGIWAATEGQKIPFNKSIDDSFFQADANGRKIIQAGNWFGSIPGSTLVRVLPRANLTALTSTGAATITVAEAQRFKVGDVLVAPPLATATFALTWANGDIANIIYGNGSTASHTVAGFTTLTALATAAAASYNADTRFAKLFVAIAAGVVVYVFPRDFATTPAFATSVTVAGGGTFAASGASFVAGLSVGTINTAGINTTTDVLTLAANAARVLPIGFPVLVRTSIPIGLSFGPVDLISGATGSHIALATGGSVYQARLEYFDGEIGEDPQFSFTYV